MLRRFALVLVLVTGLGNVPEARGGQQDVLAPDGWAALQRGDAERAAAIFRDALDRSPMNPALHYGAGFAAYLLGRYDPAIYSLKKALEFDPQFFQAAAILGHVAYARGDLGLAIRSLEKALTIRPGDPSVKAQLERWRSESSVHAGLEERTTARFTVMFEGTAQKIGDRAARVWNLPTRQWGAEQLPGETLTVICTEQQFGAARTWAEDSSTAVSDSRCATVGSRARSPLVITSSCMQIASVAPPAMPAWVTKD